MKNLLTNIGIERNFDLISLILLVITITPTLLLSQTEYEKNFILTSKENIKIDKLRNCNLRISDGIPIYEYNLNLDKQLSGKTNNDKVDDFLSKKIAKYGIKKNDLVPLPRRELSNANNRTFKFRQYFKGIPVDNNKFSLLFNYKDQLTRINNTTVPIDENFDTNYLLPINLCLLKSIDYFGIDTKPQRYKTTKVIHITNQLPKTCYQIDIKFDNRIGYYRVIIDGNTGEIYDVISLLKHCESVNGKAYVFATDPLYMANKKYGGYFTDVGNGTDDDSSNDFLNAQEKLVDLLDISYDGLTSEYRLIGPNAQNDNAYPPITDDYYSLSSDFFFNRSDRIFEAIMCYYFIDKNNRYVKALYPAGYSNIGPDSQNYTGGWKFYAHFEAETGYYGGMEQAFAFSDNCADGGTVGVDAAEDPGVITHEFFHAIQDYDGINIAYHGADEGVADYWAQSYMRTAKMYGECEEYYHTLFNWLFNSDCGLSPRRTDFTEATFGFSNGHYSGPTMDIAQGAEPHLQGQYLASALMKIYEDIGKEKTDKMVLAGLLNIDDYMNQGQWAFEFYMAAKDDLGYNDFDLCTIFHHFQNYYHFSNFVYPPLAPPDPDPDIFIKDNDEDSGEEANTSTNVYYLSPDIWVTNANLSPSNSIKWCKNENVEYTDNSPVYVHVRVRGRSCNPVTDAVLHVYFAWASTGLGWEQHWKNYYYKGHLAGDEIGPPQSLPSIDPGEEVIKTFAWYPPNPNDFDDPNDPNKDEHHWCLLARIVSDMDPIHQSEGADVNYNTLHNNNIAWRNISVFNNKPGLVPDTIEVAIRNVGGEDFIDGNSLCIEIPNLPFNSNYFNNATTQIILKEPLKSIWQSNGSRGDGFSLDESGYIFPNSNDFCIEGLSLQLDSTYLLKVKFTHDTATPRLSFNLIQKDTGGRIVGGELFNYFPSDDTAFSSIKKVNSGVTNFFNITNFYNNEKSQINQNSFDEKYKLNIYSIDGKLIKSHPDFINIKEINEHSLLFYDLPNGIYLCELRQINIVKIMKLCIIH